MQRFARISVPVAFSLVMLHPLLFGGEIFTFRDFGRYYLPVKQVCLERILAGEFPLWLPELNCGTPVHGELVHALLYPGNVLLLAGGPLSWGLYFAAHLVLAGVGMGALARRLGASDTGALLAGLAFAGSGYLVSQLHHVPYGTAAAWAPTVVLLGLRAGDRAPWAIPLLALALTMAALAGEPFTLILTLCFLAVLVLAGLTASRVRAAVGTGIAGVTALLLASPALLPAWMQIRESVRADGLAPDETGLGSVHPVRLLTLLSPEILGRQQFAMERRVSLPLGEFVFPPPILVAIHLGAVVLVAALAAPFRRCRAARVLGIVAVVAAVLALGSYVGVATALSPTVPGLSIFRYPDKYWFLVTLAAAPLAGLALEGLGRRAGVQAAVLGGLSFAACALVRSAPVALPGAAPFLLAAAVLLVRPRGFRPLLVAILGAELLLFGVRVNATAPPRRLADPGGVAALLRPLRPHRIYTYFRYSVEDADKRVPELTSLFGNALESCGGIVHGFSYAQGYDPVEPLRRVRTYFGTPAGTSGELQSRIYHRILQLVDTTHSVTNVDFVGDPAMRPVIRGPGGIRAYEYLAPAPRVRLYGDVRPVRGAEAAAKLVRDPRFDALRTLPVEGAEREETSGVPRGSLRVVRDEPHYVRIEVETDRRAWLFLADAWARGWKATVNGRAERVRSALVAFRAVPVPPGRSVVEFRYRPPWRLAVLVFFVAGLLLLSDLAVRALLTSRARRGPRPIQPSNPG